MKVFIEKKNKKLDIKFKGSGIMLLRKLKINPEEVIMVKNNALISFDETVLDKDTIKILSVVSGG
jgi:sulfur carrier protein ThiS